MRTRARYYVVRFLHDRGLHRFCRRSFEAAPDPWAALRHGYDLFGGRAPIERHS